MREGARVPIKVRDMIRRLEDDGWLWDRTRGSHRVYVHPTKSGIVVVPGKLGKDLPLGTERSILKQAGLR
jgi:predicted RNA binding protein YcfA (HicA-like mRNA interferase family)